MSEFEKLHSWISSAAKSGAIPIICGRNGDVDTVASGIALAASRPEMAACGIHLNRLARRLVEQTKAPFRTLSSTNTNWPEKIGGIIAVDAGSESQLGLELPKDVPICVIDHHVTSDWIIGEGDLEVRVKASSTTQIITNYLEEYLPNTLTNPVRKLLLAGLITDSGRFRHNEASAFSTAALLLDGADFSYASLIESMEEERLSGSDHGAIIRGLSRIESTQAGEWRVAHSRCGTQEGKLAGLILNTGADVSMVSRTRDGTTRLTTRARKSATENGINLGEIMQSIAEKLSGEGGGHAGAAGMSADCDRVRAESAFISAISAIKRK